MTEATEFLPPGGHVYLSTVEAAERLGVSKGFLDRARLTHGGPVFCAFGRAIRYRVVDLDAWAATKRRRSTSDTSYAAAPTVLTVEALGTPPSVADANASATRERGGARPSPPLWATIHEHG